MNKFTYGTRVDGAENNYKQVDLSKVDPSMPIVFVLGGNGTKNDRAAHGNLKIFSSFLGGFNDDVQFISTNYNNEGIATKYDINLNTLDIVEQLLIPKVSKDNQRLDLNDACKNLRQITFAAHCRGADIFNYIVDNLEWKLEELGYTRREQTKLLEHLFCLSYGTIHRQPHRQQTSKIVNVTSQNDTNINPDWITYQIIQNLDSINMSKQDKHALKTLDKNRVLSFLDNHKRFYCLRQDEVLRIISSNLEKNKNEENHAIGRLSRDEEWNVQDFVSETGDIVSRCIACSLCFSVANSIQNQNSKEFIPLNLDLLQMDIESITTKFNNNQQAVEMINEL